jgi:hypothetical protein
MKPSAINGPYVPKPPKHVLAEMAKTMTSEEIGNHFGATAKRARDWLARCGLKAKPMRPASRPNRIEIILGSREAVLAYIPNHDLTEAAEQFNVDLQVPYRWENIYGLRFRRTCKACLQSKPYGEMRERAGGQILHICKTCSVDTKRSAILRTAHHERIQDEFADVPKWVSLSWGQPFGGVGWHNVAGIEMAKGWVME